MTTTCQEHVLPDKPATAIHNTWRPPATGRSVASGGAATARSMPGSPIATRERSQKATLVLVVDDEPITRRTLRELLESDGYRVTEADEGRTAIARITDEVAIVLLDFLMPDIPGLDCLRYIRRQFPDVQVIMLSEVGRIRDAVTAMKEGAFEYLTKPWDREELLIRVRQAAHASKLARDNRGLRQVVRCPMASWEFVGRSPEIQTARTQIESFAQLDSTVLITGAPGTGKTTAAQMIHRKGPRASGPFISFNCASLPRDLIEAELFGYTRGAFGEAAVDRPGRIEIADGGTLLLDEINRFPLELQPKLLDFLRQRTATRIGAKTGVPVNLRVIATSQENLATACRQGRFREDLFFRINVLSLNLPPMKEYLFDVPELAREMLRRIARRRNCPPLVLDDLAAEALQSYDWPGNARELENVLEHAATIGDGRIIRRKDLQMNELRLQGIAAEGPGRLELAGMSMAEIERLAVIDTLRACGGNKAKTARQLGVSEKTIYNKIKQYNLTGKI